MQPQLSAENDGEEEERAEKRNRLPVFRGNSGGIHLQINYRGLFEQSL